MQFTNEEILNEVANIFRGRITPIKDGGVTDPIQTHAQLMEIAAITFITHQESIFYLAQLVDNSLQSVVRQEVLLIEDILVAIDNLDRVGSKVERTANLSNASTALLELDASSTVQNRPELDRFERNIDRFTDGLRPNVVDDGDLTYPREEARSIILRNLTNLKRLHDKLLTTTFNLRDLLNNFNELDMPTKVGKTAMSNIRTSLDQMEEDIESSEGTESAASSRAYLLRSLASKASVKMISNFKDPTDLKFRSPNRSIPFGITHLGYAAGTGTAPSILTTPGPWELPFSADLVLKVTEGGVDKTVSLTGLRGTSLSGRNRETFNITTLRRDIHVVIDQEVYTLTVSSSSPILLVGTPYIPLGFKHRGAMVIASWPGMSTSDTYPRVLTVGEKQTFATTTSWDLVNDIVTFSTPIIPSDYEGGTFEDSASQPWEILKILSTTRAVLDPRGTVGPAIGAGSVDFYGQVNDGFTRIFVSPSFTMAPTVGSTFTIGPTIKTGRVSIGATKTAADIISDLSDESSAGKACDPADTYAPLGFHFKSEAVPGDPERVKLSARTRMDPYMRITADYPQIQAAAPGPINIVNESAHEVVGMFNGEEDEDLLLTPAELVEAVSVDVPEVLPTIETETLYSGQLSTGIDTTEITDLSANFTTLGVVPGHQVEILSGVASGIYRVESVVSSTKLSIRRAPFQSSEDALAYNLISERVKIELANSGVNSYMELVSAPTELISASAVGSYRGTVAQFEAVTKKGENLTFNNVFPGDFLKIQGQDEVEISEVLGAVLTLVNEIPSNVSGMGFEVRGGTSRRYQDLYDRLYTFTTSSNLLRKHKFNESLDALDYALTAALTPGQAFASNLNNARKVTSDLLSIISYNYGREDEYSASIPTASDNLQVILESYSASSVPALDSLINDLKKRKYDRAVRLLKIGDIAEFFGIDSQTASMGGAVMSATNASVGDLPSPGASEFSVDLSNQLPVSYSESADPEYDFDDTFYEEDYDI